MSRPVLILGLLALVSSLGVEVDETVNSVNLKINGIVELSMTSNPSTGYYWHEETQNSSILEDASPPRYEAANSGSTAMLGAPGKQIFTLKCREGACSEGDQETVTFRYKRSWESDKPSDTMKYVVVTITN